MSTRCQIGVYEKELKKFEPTDVYIYRHHDGYPEGVIPDIIPFIKDMIKYDKMNIIACLVTYLKHWHCGSKRIDKNDNFYNADRYVNINGIEIDPYGMGIDTELHGDIEFYYAVTPTEIIVFSVDWEKDEQIFNEIKRIKILK